MAGLGGRKEIGTLFGWGWRAIIIVDLRRAQEQEANVSRTLARASNSMSHMNNILSPGGTYTPACAMVNPWPPRAQKIKYRQPNITVAQGPYMVHSLKMSPAAGFRMLLGLDS